LTVNGSVVGSAVSCGSTSTTSVTGLWSELNDVNDSTGSM
jgi:hypothetical protein